jgi:hypothetical protein
VIHRVLLALLRTRVADVGAQSTNIGGDFAAPAHELRGDPADRGAIQVERNTSRRRLDVLLLKTGQSTVIAGDRAVIAGIDAGLHALVCHGVLRCFDGVPGAARVYKSGRYKLVPLVSGWVRWRAQLQMCALEWRRDVRQ